MDKIKKKIEIKFYFFSTFRKITVVGFVNQLIKKFWPYECTFENLYYYLMFTVTSNVAYNISDQLIDKYPQNEGFA